MTEEAIKLVPTKPDSEIASELKSRLEAAMAPAMEIFDEAARHGFMIQWDSIGPGPQFRHRLNGLRLIKVY